MYISLKQIQDTAALYQKYFAAAFTGQEQQEAAFLLLPQPWYSCHNLGEYIISKPSEPGWQLIEG